MGERAHLSIGEVLSLVQEEFPDITISKIRFLESQGLLDPERTPSGYRKFYPADIERLQWILLQQRDHFLPLKVIRERLAEWDATGTRPSGSHQTPAAEDLPGADQSSAAPDVAPHETEPQDAPAAPEPGDEPSPADEPVQAPAETSPDEPDDASVARHAASSLAAGSAMEVSASAREPIAPTEDADEAPPAPDVVGSHDTETASTGGGLHVGPQDSALTADELAEQAGVDVRVVHELEGFSMIESRRVGPETYYDPEYLDIVRACRAFLDHGVEVRHLRMYKIAAEREAGVLEQLIMPLLKQRNPDARARAVETVRELSAVGEELHAALLRHALQHTLP